MKKALIFIGIAGAVTGIVIYYKKQVALLEDFAYKIIGIRFDKLPKTDAEDFIFYVKYRVWNKSKLQATITDMNLDVLMDNTRIANVEEEKDILVPANGYSDVEIKVIVNPKEIKTNVLNLAIGFAGQMNSTIRLNGYLKLKAGFIKTSVPFSYSTTLKEIFS